MLSEVDEARRYASYLGKCARQLYGTPEYNTAKRQWLQAVDCVARLERKETEEREKRRAAAESSNAWRAK
jgi:hypothetical protein